MPADCWTRVAQVLTSARSTPTTERPESSLWGNSRPSSLATVQDAPSPRRPGVIPRVRISSPLARPPDHPYSEIEPLPPGPNGLRPLRLVMAMHAREEAARTPHAQAPAYEPIELSELAYLHDPPPERVPEGSVLFSLEDDLAVLPTPQRTHYDVTRRPSLPVGPQVTYRPGAAMPQPLMGAQTTFRGRYPVLPHVAPIPEWMDSIPWPEGGPPSVLPPLKPLQPVPRKQIDHAEHARVLERLRAQGSFLPDVLNQAERGHPLMVPPRTTSLGRR